MAAVLRYVSALSPRLLRTRLITTEGKQYAAARLEQIEKKKKNLHNLISEIETNKTVACWSNFPCKWSLDVMIPTEAEPKRKKLAD